MELRDSMAAGLLALLLAGTTGSAIAAPTLSQFRFDGNCQDCAEAAEQASFPVSAWLTLQDLPATGVAGADNFFSFRYGGSNLIGAFSVTLAGGGGDLVFDPGNEDHDFSADFSGVLPGFAEVALALGDEAFAFANSARDGSWTVFRTQGIVADDFGDNGTWSRVPAPPALALVLAGLVALRATRRATCATPSAPA